MRQQSGALRAIPADRTPIVVTKDAAGIEVTTDPHGEFRAIGKDAGPVNSRTWFWRWMQNRLSRVNDLSHYD